MAKTLDRAGRSGEESAQALQRADRFLDELNDVRHGSSSRNVLLVRVGATLLVVGAAVAVLGAILSQSTNNSLDQSSDISLGLAGIAVGLLGGAVFLRYSFGQFLRFWLLRLSYENRGARTTDGSTER
jgi:hypothetical protein